MVQVSLRKIGCLVSILLLVILAGTFLLLFTDIGRHVHSASARTQPDPLDVAELHRFSPQGNVIALDPEKKAELRQIYAEIVQAYSNRQVEVLREWRWRLPEMVEMVGASDYDDIARSFHCVVYDESYAKTNKILGKESIEEKYENVGEYERYADALIAISLVYGDVQLRRRHVGGLFEILEGLIYYRIKSQRDNFRANGWTDLEKAAERALAKWIDQIESENGYTRVRLVRSIAYFRVWGDLMMEQDGQTWEEISQKQVRGVTHTLIWAGYTPKWLEEFKVIPRHASPKGESSW